MSGLPIIGKRALLLPLSIAILVSSANLGCVSYDVTVARRVGAYKSVCPGATFLRAWVMSGQKIKSYKYLLFADMGNVGPKDQMLQVCMLRPTL